MKTIILSTLFIMLSMNLMANTDIIMIPNTVVESYAFKGDSLTITTKRSFGNKGGILLELSYKFNEKNSIIQNKSFTDVTFDPRITSYVTYVKEFPGIKNPIWVVTINVVAVRTSGEWKNVEEGKWVMAVSSDGERSISLEYTIDEKPRRVIYEGKPLFGPAVGDPTEQPK